MHLLIVILAIRLFPSAECHCSERGCTGPYRLETQKIQQTITSNERYMSTVYVAPKTIKVTLGYRSRYTAYCYDGGKLDPNTGCYKEHHFQPPGFNELARWEEEQKCYYGHECHQGGTCWGSDAAKCQDTRTNLNTAKEKEYSGNNDEWLVFTHHSCISTWRCGVHSTEFPVYLRKDNKGGARPVTYTKDGKELDPTSVWSQLDQETSLLFGKIGKPFLVRSEVQCYSSGEAPTTCQFTADAPLDELRGVIFEVDPDWSASYLNVYVEVLHNISHPEDKERHGTQGTSKPHKKTKLSEAASVADLTPIMTSMVHEASETNYNLFQLFQALVETQQKLMTTIESVAKLDDELIGKILGFQSKTKWFNNRIFHLCPCYQVVPENLSNCAGGFIYKSGRYLRNGDQSECSSFSDKSVTPINMSSTVNMRFSVLHFPPPQGTTASWEGWSWLADQKQHLIDTMLFHDSVTTPGSGNPLSSVYNEGLSLFSFWNWWGRVGPIVSLVNFILTVYLLTRR